MTGAPPLSAPIIGAESRHKLEALQAIGLGLFPRNPARKRDFPGAWMVAQPLEEGEDATTTGAWCIVGDDTEALIREAFEFWEPEISEAAAPHASNRIRQPRIP